MIRDLPRAATEARPQLTHGAGLTVLAHGRAPSPMPTPASAIEALAAATLTCIVAAGLVAVLLLTGLSTRPNKRSLHVKPTPRAGGLGILADLAAAVAALRPEVSAGLWIAVLGVAEVSLPDDRRDM
jgi:UDP-N-acetylmuramyl pentapeptide phosphotransferase/UDP-N-acetylglucosamine-1-phosphate transferase